MVGSGSGVGRLGSGLGVGQVISGSGGGRVGYSGSSNRERRPCLLALPVSFPQQSLRCLPSQCVPVLLSLLHALSPLVCVSVTPFCVLV